MYEPRTIWLACAGIAALYFGYLAVQQTGIIGTSEPTAYLDKLYVDPTTDTTNRIERINRTQCLSMPNRIWPTAGAYVECIAYLAPAKQSAGPTAIVYFHGDVPRDELKPKVMADMRAHFQNLVDDITQHTKIPVFVVGRPGVLGSSGSHINGGQRDESEITNAAVDEIKQRHAVQGFVLAGQSGGARLAAQLLITGRRDIECAVMASGAYGLPRLVNGSNVRTDVWGKPGNRYLVPLHNLSDITRDTQRRLYVVGDPRDSRSPFSNQREWAEELARAGHHAVLLRANAEGKEHHGLSSMALLVASLCAAGKSDQTISEIVAKASADKKP